MSQVDRTRCQNLNLELLVHQYLMDGHRILKPSLA